jgi:hypothetical protein
VPGRGRGTRSRHRAEEALERGDRTRLASDRRPPLRFLGREARRSTITRRRSRQRTTSLTATRASASGSRSSGPTSRSRSRLRRRSSPPRRTSMTTRSSSIGTSVSRSSHRATGYLRTPRGTALARTDNTARFGRAARSRHRRRLTRTTGDDPPAVLLHGLSPVRQGRMCTHHALSPDAVMTTFPRVCLSSR